jgi:endo-1,4-beta-xylanase
VSFSRRGVLAGALALAACDRKAESAPAPVVGPVGPLKADAPFPLGVCAQVNRFEDPAWVALATRNFSQITPEWEMKMEYVVLKDGSLRFDRPDRIAAFCKANGMGLFGHTLIWYAQTPESFERLAGDKAAFTKAYDAYIETVVGRYRGQASAWDVVNEPVAEEGEGLREHLWSKELGEIDYIRRAYERAHAADPDAVLFLNDYNFEYYPKKLDTFQRLVERLLAAGTPLGGLGAQTHTWATLEPGKIREAIKAIGRFGLPVHVSELDVSIIRGKPGGRSPEELREKQARLFAEAAEALGDLPQKQRYGLTLWGLRDKDSWLVQENAGDAPLLFDDQGRPKAGAAALSAALKRLK